MQKTASGLIAILGLACCQIAQASPVASVDAVASPAWVQRDDSKYDLRKNAEINIGDHVVTGDSGLLEIQLWSGIELRVYSASEIKIVAPAEPGFDPSGNPPLLVMQRGRICLESPPASSTGNNFDLKVADLLLAAIQQYGHICVSRREGMSSINLRAGSVQITNMLDPAMVILSEAGIEFRMDDEGSYQLLPSAEDAVMADMNSEPFIVYADVEQEVPALETDEIMKESTAAEESDVDESGKNPDKNASSYIYTVYLFSTRSEEIANQVNDRFLRAGHQSLILINQKDSPVRYRIAVSGFESRQSAEKFADSIVGKLGVRDTWIGRDENAEPSTVESDVKQENPDLASDDTKPDITLSQDLATSEPEAESGISKTGYIYTVYLFSTRSEEVANQVNQRFRQAGHKTRILVNENESPPRYRIAVTGFESRQSALDFADSIVGKLGIKDTWIGRDRPDSEN